MDLESIISWLYDENNITEDDAVNIFYDSLEVSNEDRII